jgi:hypothetical protein
MNTFDCIFLFFISFILSFVGIQILLKVGSIGAKTFPCERIIGAQRRAFEEASFEHALEAEHRARIAEFDGKLHGHAVSVDYEEEASLRKRRA